MPRLPPLGDIDFYAGTLLIDDLSVLAANYALNFTVTTNLSDGGINSGNALQLPERI